MSKLADRIEGLKAYSVIEDFESTGGIIFATSGVAARRIGADQFADGEFSNVSCRRAAYADEFSFSGSVPAYVLIENGWHFECFGCGMRIDEDSLSDEALPTSGVLGSGSEAVFCNVLCKAEYNLDLAERKYIGARWIRRFQKIVAAKFPLARTDPASLFMPHSHVTFEGGKKVLQQASVSFSFSGMVHGPATLKYDRHKGGLRFECCSGDRLAFEKFAAEQKSLRAHEQENGDD